MSQKLIKLNASPEAENVLERMLQKTNDGYDGGRVTKAQLLSWIITRFEERYFEKSLDQIRRAHFSPLAFYELTIQRAKRAAREGAPVSEVNALLRNLAKHSKTSLDQPCPDGSSNNTEE